MRSNRELRQWETAMRGLKVPQSHGGTWGTGQACDSFFRRLGLSLGASRGEQRGTAAGGPATRAERWSCGGNWVLGEPRGWHRWSQAPRRHGSVWAGSDSLHYLVRVLLPQRAARAGGWARRGQGRAAALRQPGGAGGPGATAQRALRAGGGPFRYCMGGLQGITWQHQLTWCNSTARRTCR